MEYNEKDENGVGSLQLDFEPPQELECIAPSDDMLRTLEELQQESLSLHMKHFDIDKNKNEVQSIQRNIKKKTTPKKTLRRRPPTADPVPSPGANGGSEDFESVQLFLPGFRDPNGALIEIPDMTAGSSKLSQRPRPIRARNAMSGGSKRSLLRLHQEYNGDYLLPFPQEPTPTDQIRRSRPNSRENVSRRIMQRLYEPVEFEDLSSYKRSGVLPRLNGSQVTQEIFLGPLFGNNISDTKEVRKIVFERLRVLWTLSSSFHEKSHQEGNSHLPSIHLLEKTRSPFECTLLLMRLCKATGVSYKDYTKKIQQQLNWYRDVNFDSFCELLTRGTIGPAFSRIGKDQTLDIFLHAIQEVVDEIVVVFKLTEGSVHKRLKDVQDIRCVLNFTTPPAPSLSAPKVIITESSAIGETPGDHKNENKSTVSKEKESLGEEINSSSLSNSNVQTMPSKASAICSQQPSETLKESSITLVHSKEKQPASYEMTRTWGRENARVEEARAVYEASIKNKLLLRKYAHPSRLNGSEDSLVERAHMQVDLALEGKPLDRLQGPNISHPSAKYQYDENTGPRPSSPSRLEADNELPVDSDPNEQVLVCGSCRVNEAILWCSSCFSVYCSSCWGSSHGTTVDFTSVKDQCLSTTSAVRDCGTADILAPKSRRLRQQMIDVPPVAIIYLPTKQPPSNGHIVTARSSHKIVTMSHSISTPTLFPDPRSMQVTSQPLALPPLKQTRSLLHNQNQKPSIETASTSDLLKSLLTATTHPRSLEPRTYKDPKHRSSLIPKVAEVNFT